MTGFVCTSDVHLMPDDEQAFRDWVTCVEHGLAKIQGKNKTILILGDLWEIYIHGNSYYSKATKAFQKQREIWASRNIKVEWYEGNHDLFLPEADHVFDSQGTKFYACHGDRLNPHDVNYLRLKKILHRRPVKLALKFIPGRIVERMGHRMSHQSKTDWVASKTWNWTHYRDEISKRIPQWKTENINLMVFGHCHWKKDETIKNFRIINLGHFPKDKSIFVIEGAHTEWVTI